MPNNPQDWWVEYPPIGNGGVQQGRPEAPERYCGYLYVPDPTERRGWRQRGVYAPKAERRRHIGFRPAPVARRKR